MKRTTKYISFILLFFTIFNSITYASQSAIPDVYSPSYIIIDANTGQIISSRNAYEQHYPASITKIITAILTLENCKLDDKAVASKRAVFDIESDSNNAGFKPGEEITIRDLLYALLLASANESANILAEHVGGTIENFADMMNKRAKELGALNTHFVTPNGLFKPDHVTTSYDMAMIAKHAMTIPEFRSIVSTVLYKMPQTNLYKGDNKYFLNSNKLIKKHYASKATDYYYPYSIGIKTGYTVKANHTLVAGASKDGIELIAVFMNSKIVNGRLATYTDATKLFDYVFENYHTENVLKKGDIVKSVNVNGKNVDLVAADSVNILAQNGSKTSFSKVFNINSNLKAPIAKNQKLGTIDYYVNNSKVKTVNLLATTQVQRFNTPIQIIKTLFIVLLEIIGVIIMLFVLFILVLLVLHKIKRGRRNRYTRF